MKQGILVVSFGTTYRETREKNIGAIEQDIRAAYPEIPCYVAYSGSRIRKILKERDGIVVMDSREALQKMKEDGITRVVIQPTHIMDGIENHVLKEIAERWRPEFDSMQVGMPLLAKQEDHEKIAEILWKALSPQIIDKTLIFMGHGTHHEANVVYRQLEETFHRMGHEEVYIATVEAEPALEDVMARMAKKKRRGVVLTPLMLVAGDHAVHDMMGAEDSYLGKLIKQGYQVEVICKGLGEYADIRALYLSHLKKSMAIL